MIYFFIRGLASNYNIWVYGNPNASTTRAQALLARKHGFSLNHNIVKQ